MSTRITIVALSVVATLTLGACRSTPRIDSAENAALNARFERVSAAIDAEVAAQHDVADEYARGRRLEQLASASTRLGATRMLTYGSSLVPNAAQHGRAVRELARLESELGVDR